MDGVTQVEDVDGLAQVEDVDVAGTGETQLVEVVEDVVGWVPDNVDDHQFVASVEVVVMG